MKHQITGAHYLNLFDPLVIKNIYSQADQHMNCACDNKSMKFGTKLGHAIRKCSGYRAIADSLLI